MPILYWYIKEFYYNQIYSKRHIRSQSKISPLFLAVWKIFKGGMFNLKRQIIQ